MFDIRQIDNAPHCRPIFIVGLGRSGTTLVSTILNSHSQVYIGPETKFYLRAADPAREGLFYSSQQNRRRLIEEYLSAELIKALSLEQERDELISCLASKSDLELHELFSIPIQISMLKHGKQIWGEKSPDHLLHLDRMYRDFPEARVIVVLRDPRGVLVSRRKLGWANSHLFAVLQEWLNSIAIFDRIAAANPDGIQCIVYDQLLSEPKVALSELCERLNIAFEQQLLSHDRAGGSPQQWRGASWLAKASEPIDPGRKDDWKRSLCMREISYVSYFCGNELRRFGLHSESGYPALSMFLYGVYLRASYILLLIRFRISSVRRRLR